MSSLLEHSGFNLHYNDPSLFSASKRHADVEANIAPYLVIDLRPSTVPRFGIMYFTTRAMKAGEELLQDWGGDTWVSISEMYLDNQARCAHWYHRYETKLRIRAAARGLEITPAQLAEQPPVSGNNQIAFKPDGEGRFGIADYVVDNMGVKACAPDKAYVRWCASHAKEEGRVMPPLDQGMRVLSDEQVPEAFAAADCEHIEKVNKSKLDSATLQQLYSYKTFFPAASVEERALLRGVKPPKVAVAEVMATYNPARWISSPDTSAYALVVRPGETVKKGEPVCLYAGRLWTQESFDAKFRRSNLQYYAYDVPPEWSGVDIAKRCRNAGLPPPPQLVVEALSRWRGPVHQRLLVSRWWRIHRECGAACYLGR